MNQTREKNKEVYTKNDVMATVIKRSRGEKKKSDSAIEEYSVKNFEIGPCLYEHYKKKQN